MAMRLDFAATIRRFAVLYLTSNMFVNKHSDFLELGFLTGDDVICTLGLLCFLIITFTCMLIYIFDVVHTAVFKIRPGE